MGELLVKNVPVYEFSKDYLNGNKSYVLGDMPPPQDIPDEEKDPLWYAHNVWYHVKFYNRTVQMALTSSTGMNSNYTDGSYLQPFYLSPIMDMYKFMFYALGKQANENFSTLERNYTTTNSHAIWIKGKKLASMLDTLTGVIRTNLSNANWSAITLSSELQKKKSVIKAIMEARADLKEQFDELEKMGVSLGGGLDVAEGEDKEAKIQSILDKEATKAAKEAKSMWWLGEWSSDYVQQATWLWITGISCTEHKVINGKNVKETFPATHAIIDTRHDDDYNRKAQFWGRIELLTPEEIFKQFPDLTYEQRQDIKKMSGNLSDQNFFNSFITNLKWWTGGTSNLVTTVKTFWRSCNKEGLDDYIATATIIGNKYIANYGRATNIPDNIYSNSPDAPISFYLPNMKGGWVTSVVARLYELQDELDMLKMSIRTMVGDGKGKKYIIKGWMLGGDVDTKELIHDFSSLGLHVAKSDDEIVTNENADNRLMEMVDMTLDPNIMRIAEIARMKDQEMQEAINISDIFLGQQKQYVGQMAMNTSIGQSSLGMRYLFDGYMDYIQRNMQFALNRQKLLDYYNGLTEKEVTAHDGAELIKIDKDYSLQRQGLIMKLNDLIDAEQKANLQKQLEIASQNPQQTGIFFKDVLAISNAQTYSEAKTRADEAFARFEKMQKEANEAAMAQQQETVASQEMMQQIGIIAEQIKELNAIDRKGQWDATLEQIKALEKTNADLVSRMMEQGFMPPPPLPQDLPSLLQGGQPSPEGMPIEDEGLPLQ